ncbi:hypothetical protein MCEMSEM23_02298 [Rhabdaerophilaceae bacterium]
MRFFPVCLAALLLSASLASGETVQVVSGSNDIGQGWMFLAQDGRCKVLTAAHVISRNGQPVPVLVRDRRRRELETGQPEIFSLTPDIAVIPVRTGNSFKDCSASRLSMVGVDRRVQNLKEGIVERTGLSEIARFRVMRAASSMDKAGGEIFAVRPVDPSLSFQKGWSGSILLDDEGPLGVVFAAEEGEASVVRIDTLTRLTPLLTTASQNTREIPEITVLLGETVSPDQGPRGMFENGASPWRVSPLKQRVEFVLSFRSVRTTTGVSVSLTEGDTRLRAIEFLVGVGGDDFISVNTCSAIKPTSKITCPFNEQTRQRIKVIVTTEGDDVVAIRQTAIW